MKNPSEIRDIVVVGGGLAGLATATYAARAGLETTVVERRPHLGGRAATRHRGDFSLNLGAHALYSGGEAAQVLSELGVRYSGGTPKGRSLALYRDKLGALPLSTTTLLMTRLLDAGAKIELASAFARIPTLDAESVRGLDARTFIASFVSRAASRAFLEAFVRLATFVSALDELDASTAVRQIQKARHGVTYVDDGWGSLVQGLADCARDAGAGIHLGMRVSAIVRRTGGGYTLWMGDRSVSARSVVLATSREDAAPVLEPLGHRLELDDAPPVRVAALDVALERLPDPRRTFVLGIDRPLYYSVHSAAARLAPEGAAVVHLVRYGEDDESGPSARAELEDLLDRIQPGWRRWVIEQQFLPRMQAASRLDRAQSQGDQARPEVRLEDDLFVVGDWVRGGSWLSDASLGAARLVGQALAASARNRQSTRLSRHMEEPSRPAPARNGGAQNNPLDVDRGDVA